MKLFIALYFSNYFIIQTLGIENNYGLSKYSLCIYYIDYSLIFNVGIILFTVFIRILLLPVTFNQLQSTQKTQALTPKVIILIIIVIIRKTYPIQYIYFINVILTFFTHFKQIKEIKEKYPDDKNLQNQLVALLYEETKVSLNTHTNIHSIYTSSLYRHLHFY